ncbi:zwei Ig domain protein zig-8 isoform X1 [Drosophila obscura]|uniref:zwei Ig domain protein zig-8 isoform X1 n=1 Tax=Drosophila obscura TaxID=7282 RepID=UPI001BB19D4E|nr:zwei Ig domain protein zig-8 isoform X1 [Drosophila obscura]
MSMNWALYWGIMWVLSGSTDSASKRFFTDFLQDLPTPGTGGPTFDPSAISNITGLVGKTVKMTCRVKNLGNRTVSWVRHRDIHLLTVGRYTYTSDQRFEAQHSPHAEDWSLRIRYAQRKDSGIYECQISTTPPIGHAVYLNIVEPITEVIGGPDLHINKGSTINLTCIVKFAPEPPPTVSWSHNRENDPRYNKVINFDSPRGGISLVTEKGVLTTSRLLVQKAIQEDEGLYTCAPSNANPTSVRVHIVDGEHPAAMHHGNSAPLQPPALISMLMLICSTLILLHASACCSPTLPKMTTQQRRGGNNNNNGQQKGINGGERLERNSLVPGT